MITEHFGTVIERDPPKLALHRLRTFTHWYSHGLPAGRDLRRTLGGARCAADVLHAVDVHFAHCERSERGSAEAAA